MKLFTLVNVCIDHQANKFKCNCQGKEKEWEGQEFMKTYIKELQIVLLEEESRFVVFLSLTVTDVCFLHPSETGGFLDPSFNLLFVFV